MTTLELMKKRHSVRQYTGKKIEEEKRAVLDALCKEINDETGMHFQMIYEDSRCFNSFLAHYGRFTGCNDYIALVGPKDENLDEKVGYYGEKLVMKAQELGLNTCWAALTHGKTKAEVNKGEKQAIIIALGYGATQGISHKNKDLATLAKTGADDPRWYKDGVEAALLAPTAVNQQQFYIDRQGDKVTITARKGPCFMIDLGIVKYHFEAASGHTVE